MTEPGSFQAPKARFKDHERLAALFIALLFVSACSGKPHVLKQTDIEIKDPHKIYIVRQDLHTGFVLPARSIRSHLPRVVDQSGGSEYLEFGSLLLAFIEQSFLRDSEGQIIESSGSVESDSQFYRAEGDYYLWNTCNNWTAKGLKSAGQGISPTFKITAGSVMAYFTKHKEENTVACNQGRPPDMTGVGGF